MDVSDLHEVHAMKRYLHAIALVPYSIKALIVFGVIGFVAGSAVIASGAKSIGLFVALPSFVTLFWGIVRWNIYAWNKHLRKELD